MKWRKLDTIPVDLADVEVLADGGDVGGGDVVCGAPDAFCGGVLVLLLGLEMRWLRGDGSRGLLRCPNGLCRSE